MTKHSRTRLALLLLALVTGCDTFDPGSLVVGTRVLGARVEVEGEPERAAPRPGETAHVRWIMAAPSEMPSLRWLFSACASGGANKTSCAADPLVFEQGEGLVPSLVLHVPEPDALNGAESIEVLGVICDGGTPELGAEGALRCAGSEAHGTAVRLEIALDLGQRGNLNPRLDDAHIRLDARPWDELPGAEPSEACSAAVGLPTLRANGKKHRIDVELGADVRELYTRPDSERSQYEELQISHFVSAGELAGQYSFVEPSDSAEAPQLSFEWEAPHAKDVPPEGQRVRLFLVVRDMRGGLDVTERALCVVR